MESEAGKLLTTYALLGTLFRDSELAATKRAAVLSLEKERGELIQARSDVKNGKFDKARKALRELAKLSGESVARSGMTDGPGVELYGRFCDCLDEIEDKNRLAAFNALTQAIQFVDELIERVVRGEFDDK